MNKSSSKNNDQLAMRVNHHPVSIKELEEEWRLVQQKTGNNAQVQHFSPKEKSIYSQTTLTYAKENIINRITVEEEATSAIKDIAFKEVTTEYEKMMEHFGGEAEFQKKFSAAGSNGDVKNKIPSRFELLEKIERSLKIDALLNSWKKNIPTENEIVLKNFYEENIALYKAEKRVLLNYVVAKMPTAKLLIALQTEECDSFFKQEISVEAAHKKLKSIFLQAGQNFDQAEIKTNVLIEANSNFSLAQLSNDIFFKDYPLNISGLVHGKDAVVWFKVLQKLPAGTWEYQHIKKIVRENWLAKEQKLAVSKQTSALRKKAEIEDFYAPTPTSTSTSTPTP